MNEYCVIYGADIIDNPRVEWFDQYEDARKVAQALVDQGKCVRVTKALVTPKKSPPINETMRGRRMLAVRLRNEGKNFREMQTDTVGARAYP